MEDEVLSIFTGDEFDDYAIEATIEILSNRRASSKYNISYFEDEIWEFFCDKNNVMVKFNFTEVLTIFNSLKIFNYKVDLKVLLKCWIASNTERYSLVTLARSLKEIVKYFELCSDITKINNNTLDSLLKEFSIHQQPILASAILNLSFYNEDLIKVSVINYFSNLEFKHSKSVRVLPSTHFLLIFHKKIEEFEKELKKQPVRNQILHYLIKIWWELTMFIPMRPIEVARIKYKDIKKEKNKVYLTFERNKSYKNSVRINKIVIPERLYKTIRKYYRESREYGRSVTLFSRKALPMRGKPRHKLSGYFNRGNLDYALKKYVSLVFNEYEHEKYKNDIKLFTPIVTRHMAIINLVRQGYNHYEIAELAGHRTTITQNHYSKHAKNLIDLDLINIFNSFNYESNESVFTIYRKYKKVVAKEKDLNTKHHDLPIGFCTDLEMNCPVRQCFDCKYWRITGREVVEHYKILADYKIRKQNQIKETLLKMVNIYNDIQQYKRKEEVDKSLDRELKESAKKLETLISQFKDFDQVFISGEIENGKK